MMLFACPGGRQRVVAHATSGAQLCLPGATRGRYSACVTLQSVGYGRAMTSIRRGFSKDRYLSIYVNDHRAAAAGGVALARRMIRENAGSEFSRDVVEAVAGEIGEDKATLDRVARLLGVRPNGPKIVVARVAELAGRLKLNGQLRGYSPLSRLIEIETLMAGIEAKRCLWVSLQEARRRELAEIDFERLVARAKDQRNQLVPLQRHAADLALSLIERTASL